MQQVLSPNSANSSWKSPFMVKLTSAFYNFFYWPLDSLLFITEGDGDNSFSLPSSLSE